MIALAALLSTSGSSAAGDAPDPAQFAQPSAVQVELAAPLSTISWNERDPDRQHFDLPLLYLHRERKATPAYQRTLIINLLGFAEATQLRLEAVSGHENVATGVRHRLTRNIVTPARPCTAEHPCPVTWTFDAATTPSDLYELRVLGQAGNTLWQEPSRPDFAMLDTWDVPVSSGTEPYTVRVTYATLFPFAKGQNDNDNRLAPDRVTGFIEDEFVSIIKDTWRVQVEDWGFGEPLHPDWDADRVVDVTTTDPPFALFAGIGTYSHFVFDDGKPYPECRIWWFSSNYSFQPYESLAKGTKCCLPTSSSI